MTLMKWPRFSVLTREKSTSTQSKVIFHILLDQILQTPPQQSHMAGYGMSGLMYACDRGYWRITEHLVTKCDNKVNLDQADEYGQTSLMFAAFTGHWKICQLLLLRGAKVNLKTHNNQTALMKAVYGSCGVQLLIFDLLTLDDSAAAVAT